MNRNSHAKDLSASGLAMVGFLWFTALWFSSGCDRPMDADVAALVNGKPVSMQMLKISLVDFSESQTTTQRRIQDQVLEQLIGEELILQAAEKQGIRATEDEMAEQIKLLEAGFPKDALQDVLIKEYVDMKTWEQGIRRRIIIGKMTEHVVKNRLQADPEAWTRFFESQKAKTGSRKRVQLLHITTGNRVDAERALTRVKNGEPFDKVAEEFRQTPPDEPSNRPIWVFLEKLPKEMVEVIENTPEGGVGNIVESQYGYTIFKVQRVEEAENDPSAHLREIRQNYHKMEKEKVFAQWMKELRENAKIKINPALAVKQ